MLCPHDCLLWMSRTILQESIYRVIEMCMASVMREVSSAQCNGVDFVGVLSLGKIVKRRTRTDFGVCGEGGEEAVEVLLVHVAEGVGAGIGTFPAKKDEDEDEDEVPRVRIC
ncbi:hypothetical protein ACFX2H_008883 [Malus domestica]